MMTRDDLTKLAREDHAHRERFRQRKAKLRGYKKGKAIPRSKRQHRSAKGKGL